MSAYEDDTDLGPYTLGDKWPGVEMGPVTIDDAAPGADLVKVRMQFTHSKSPSKTFILSSDAGETPDAPITISDAVNWEVVIPEIQVFLPIAGQWDWDIEFYEDGDTNPITFYRGSIIVRNDITKN